MARNGGAQPAFTHHRRGESGRGNRQQQQHQTHHLHHQPLLRPETSHGRPPGHAGGRGGGGRGNLPDDPLPPSLRGNSSPKPGTAGPAAPRELVGLTKKLIAGRRERDRQQPVEVGNPLAIARRNQGPPGGGDNVWYDDNHRHARKARGLLNDRESRVPTSGGLPHVDLSQRPTHPPAAKKKPASNPASPAGVGRDHQHEPRAPSKRAEDQSEEEDEEDADDDDEVEVVEDGNRSSATKNQNEVQGSSVDALRKIAGQPRRKQKQFGGSLRTAASRPRRGSVDRGNAASLAVVFADGNPRKADASQGTGTTKENAISLCNSNSDTDNDDDEDSPNKKRKGEGGHQALLQQPATGASRGGAATSTGSAAAAPPARKSQWASLGESAGERAAAPALPPRPMDPRRRPNAHAQNLATTNILEVTVMPLPPKPSAPEPFKTPRAADRDVDDNNGRRTASEKSSGADTLKSVPSKYASGPDSSENSAQGSDDRMSVETRLAKKRERSGDISKPIPRKNRCKFFDNDDEDDVETYWSDDLGEQVAQVMKVANEDPPLGLPFPVSRCSGPSLRSHANYDDRPQNGARGRQSSNPRSSAFDQLASTAKKTASGVYNSLFLTKHNSKKPGSSSGKRIIPGSTLTQASAASKEPELAWRWAGSTRSTSREVDFERESLSMSRPQTRSQSRSKVPEPVIELLSDDDESENDGVGAISEDAKTGSKTSKLELDVLTIGIGKAVHSSSCRITFDTREDKYELSFVRAPKKGRETRSSYFSWSSNADVIRRSIHVDDLLEVKFHAVGRGNGAIPCDDDDESADDSQQQMSFLAMRIDIEGESDFRLELRDLAPTSKQDKLKYVVVEFRNDNDLKQCIHHLRGSKEWRAMLENGELDETDCYIYSTALIEHYKSEVKSRRSALASPSLKHRDDDFVRSRNADDILLVYPFNGDAAEIEKAAEGLTEARGLDVPEDAGLNVVSDADADDPAKFSGRGHYMTIRVADYERLEPGEYLNDTLIDFWMQWIARRADRSKIHIFSSHFYSTLKKNSPEDIAKWTKNKGINVFEKQLVFIPVNQTLHWSLCVIVNPGAIANGHKVGAPEDLWPGIFFFDSLKAHQKGQVTKDVRKWLNTECKRLFDSDQSTLPADMASLLTNDERAYETEWRSFPFTSKTMKCSSPKVPYQNNGSDCGVFVCRYAYSMYELTRRAPITFAFTPGHLTASDEFSFNTGDIARIREEVKTLIRRLTKVYAPWKETELQREKEENAERKVAPRHEATKPKGNSDPDSPDDQGGELEKHSSKELCSDLATTETSTATAMSNDVKIDSPLSPGGEPSVESHDRATSAALNAACNSLILNDVSARKPPSPSSVPGDESLNAACGFVRLGDLGSNTPLSPSSLQADVHGGVSNETSLVSSAIVSEGADLSNLRCLRHPGDPGFPEANASSAVHSIGKGLSHVSPQKETEIRDATSGDSGTVDPSMVLKDVENKTTRSMEPQKAQPSLRCLSEENLNAVASPILGPSALQYGSGNSECIHSSAKGSRDRDDHLAGGCTTLHIASSSSSECTQQIEEDSGQDDTPDCEMEAATVGDDEVDAPEDLFPFSSAFEPMKRIGSVERGVALLTTNDDSRMDTSN